MTGSEYLVFRLAGVLSAFGAPAIGEQRPVWEAPSKSGILGLVGAALGLDRDQTSGLDTLQDALSYAVRLDTPGRPSRDFHTAESPRGLGHRTRRDELAAPELTTILSDRRYRSDVVYTVALWRCGAIGPSLTVLARALQRPRYVLYLGRKSCPLSAPPRPLVLNAPDIRAAFDAHDRRAGRPQDDGKAPIWCDIGAPGIEDGTSRTRRDRVRDRGRWLFETRTEGRLAAVPGDVGS